MIYYIQTPPSPGNSGLCERMPHLPPCQNNGGEPATPINSIGFSLLIIFLIAVVVWTKFFDKSR